MNRYFADFFGVLSGLLLWASAASSIEIDNFPESCSEASTRYSLPGHMIRLGMVRMGPEGLVFSFPDQNDPDGLQQVEIADNVGLIGQNPNRDYSNLIRIGTPSGSFVVAQLFIGDEDSEPVVTCLSRVRPLSGYVWSDYGTSWSWLNPSIFRERLRWKKYSRWNWRTWHRRDFSSIRKKFRDSDERNRFRKTDRDSRRDRVNKKATSDTKKDSIANLPSRSKKADNNRPKSKVKKTSSIIDRAKEKAAKIKKKLLEEETEKRKKN